MTTAGESAGRRLTSPAWSRRGRERPLLPRFVSARAGGIATAAALAAIGLWFVWQASLLDLGDFELPGPGFFPLVLGAVVFICASFLAARLLGVIDARRNHCLRASRRSDRDRRTVRRAAAVRSPGRADHARSVRSRRACARGSLFAVAGCPFSRRRDDGVLVLLSGSARSATPCRVLVRLRHERL